MSENSRRKYNFSKRALLDIKIERQNYSDKFKSISLENVLILNRSEVYQKRLEIRIMRMNFHKLPPWAVLRRPPLTNITSIGLNPVLIDSKLELKSHKGLSTWPKRKTKTRNSSESKVNNLEEPLKGFPIVSKLWASRSTRSLTPQEKYHVKISNMCSVKMSSTLPPR